MQFVLFNNSNFPALPGPVTVSFNGLHRECNFLAVSIATMNKIEEYSLKFDGVYTHDSLGRGDNIYLRFYENGGAVCTILKDRLSPAQIYPHLTESNPGPYKGNYSVVEDNICVTVAHGDVSIELSGKWPKGEALYVEIVFSRAGAVVQKKTGIWLDYAQPIYLDHNLSHEILKTFLDPGLITVKDIADFADQLRDFGNRVGQRSLEHWIDAIKTDHLDGLIGLVNMGRKDALTKMIRTADDVPLAPGVKMPCIADVRDVFEFINRFDAAMIPRVDPRREFELGVAISVFLEFYGRSSSLIACPPFPDWLLQAMIKNARKGSLP